MLIIYIKKNYDRTKKEKEKKRLMLKIGLKKKDSR